MPTADLVSDLLASPGAGDGQPGAKVEPRSAQAALPEASQQAGAAHQARSAQQAWAAQPIAERLSVLRRMRHLLAAQTEALTAAIAPELARNAADTLSAEVLPLLAACRFLEQKAATILAPRALGRDGLPLWLRGVDTTVERVPLGTVLVIAPANYPLFLPGVQTLGALAAGNAVVLKPGRGGRAVALVLAAALAQAGLPAGLLRVTDESTEAARQAMQLPPAKVVFTGSAAAGHAIQRLAAETSTPVVAELSGCDAVFVLPGANHDLVLDALAFGMRLNESATCMAPRRLFLVGEHAGLVGRLLARFDSMSAVRVTRETAALLEELLRDADRLGAKICGQGATGMPDEPKLKPLLILRATPAMRIACSDVFAPVLSVFEVDSVERALHQSDLCPLALTASIFGPEREARALAARLPVGTVTINDLIVPTADPRISFGGRGASGFGQTRGAEGLLEMTAVRTVAVRRSRSRRHLQATGLAHVAFFAGYIAASHAGSWSERWNGVRQLVSAHAN